MKRFINSLKDASRFAVRAGCLVGLLSAVAPAPSAWGVPITVTFRDAVLAGGVPTTLPSLLLNDPRNVYLRFNVPDFDQIVSINSVDVTVHVYDDADVNLETGEILFAVRAPDTDFTLGLLLSGDLGGTNFGAPFVFTYSLSPPEIASAFPTITDNDAFRIRVKRTSGDFYVLDGEVIIDANLRQVPVPEPTSLILLGSGLAWLAAWSRRKKR